MGSTVQLVFVIHNHQPVGNFDHVFHEACERAYLPFLRTLLDFPSFSFGLHTSGCLLEWLETNRPEYFELVRELLSRGQLELLGGGMYEPILPILPRSSLSHQIERLSGYLEEHFGTKPAGMWVPERVWEPQLAGQLSPWMQYTLLDDHHFEGNALPSQVASEYFRTEGLQGGMALLPISRELRYCIPFKPAEAALEYLDWLRSEHPAPLAVFGDDGEKFGVWPDTYEWVYERGWLREFLTSLTESDWVQTVLPRDVVASRAPAASVSIPCRSYVEMGEWSRVDPLAEPNSPPGHWRNYFTKYGESHDMYRRMLSVTKLFEIAEDISQDEETDLSLIDVSLLRDDLLRSQVNCAYWHGVFGGLYLNHLRHATNRSMLRAESRLLSIAAADIGSWLEQPAESVRAVHSTSFLSAPDGSGDIMLRSPGGYSAWIDAGSGFCLRRLDDLAAHFCWSDVLTRRLEHYHHKLTELAVSADEAQHQGQASIHDRVVTKEQGLEAYLVFDPHQRVSFTTCFSDVHDPRQLTSPASDTVPAARYAWRDYFTPAADVTALGPAVVGARVGYLRKTVAGLEDGLEFTLAAETLPPLDFDATFWVEFNFTVLTDSADDRWLSIADQRVSLREAKIAGSISSVALHDGWQRRVLRLSTPCGATLITYPVYTVSNSEGGFERTYQGTCLLFGFDPGALLNGITVQLTLAGMPT